VRVSLIVVFASLLTLSRVAKADEPPNSFRLSWSAPAGCPSTDDVRSATLRNVVDAKAAKNDDVLEADAHVEKNSDAAWRVRLKTRRGGATGEREIEASTCRGVADATAVVLALALVPPGSAPEEPKSQVINVEEKPALPSPAAAETTEPKPKRTAKSDGPPLLAFGASVATDASSLPSAALGGGLTLALTPKRFRFEAEGQRFAGQSQAASGSNAGAEFAMTTIGGRACYAALRSGSGRFEAAPCVGSHVVLIDAGGFGSDANFDKSEAWTTLNGGVLGRAQITSWFALRAKVDAFAPLSRPTFVVQNGTGFDDVVHRPPTLGVSVAFGAELLFL